MKAARVRSLLAVLVLGASGCGAPGSLERLDRYHERVREALGTSAPASYVAGERFLPRRRALPVRDERIGLLSFLSLQGCRLGELAGYRNMLSRTPANGYIGTCAAIRDTDLTETTRHLGLPALCVVGDEDGATPPDVVGGLADLLPEGRLEVVTGSGHLPCIDQARVLAGSIRGFAKEVGLV